MSDDKSVGQGESFTSKLDIVMVSPTRLRKMIDLAASVPRAVVCAVGKSGIGKTAIPKQAAKARKNSPPYAAVYLPTTNIEDFSVPSAAPDTRKYYDKRIPRFFQPLLDWIEKYQGHIEPGQGPILVFEEINRARDKNVTNACFTIIEDRVIGDVKLPDELQIIVTMNPSGGGMSVNEFERDPAFRRRVLWVGVTPSYGEFLQFAKKEKFHKHVIEHLEAQSVWFYVDAAVAAGKVFPCPASWETVSDICKALEHNDVDLGGSEAKALFAGKIGLAAAEAFIDFIKDNNIVITAKDVLTKYKPESEVRSRVLALKDSGKQPALIALCSNVAAHLFNGDNKPPKAFSAQLALFMSDLEQENLQVFINALQSNSTALEGGERYLRQLTQHIHSSPDCAVAMTRLSDAQNRVESQKG